MGSRVYGESMDPYIEEENRKCDPRCLTPLRKDIARTLSSAIMTSTNRAGGKPCPCLKSAEAG